MIVAKLPDGRLLVKETTAGPASYAAGGFSVTLGDLKRVESVLFVGSNGGYLCEENGITNNTVTVKVYQFDYAATAAGPAVEVPDATDLSGVNFTVIAIGF